MHDLCLSLSVSLPHLDSLSFCNHLLVSLELSELRLESNAFKGATRTKEFSRQGGAGLRVITAKHELYRLDLSDLALSKVVKENLECG